MTEPKWTPGPWAIDIDPRPGMEWNRHIVSAANPVIRIAFMTSDGPCADAHLIAAAPELYEALKALLPEGWDDGAMDHMPGVKLARLALAKAGGPSCAVFPEEA